jgi:hypothetical protein
VRVRAALLERIAEIQHNDLRFIEVGASNSLVTRTCGGVYLRVYNSSLPYYALPSLLLVRRACVA